MAEQDNISTTGMEEDIASPEEPITEPGQEFPEESAQTYIQPEEIEKWRAKYPFSKFGFFMHVNDPYLYRSYTTKELKAMTAERKKREEALKRQLTDDEFLVLMLGEFVLIPSNIQDRVADETMPAGIPHLLYDLINHLSGFSDVEPVIL